MDRQKKITFLVFTLVALFVMPVSAKKYRFHFGDGNKICYQNVNPNTIYGSHSSFGYDLGTKPCVGNPYFFSVDLPEGNYRVTMVLGDKNRKTNTTIKTESRRLMLQNIVVPEGKFAKKTFNVNIRNKMITSGTDTVRTKNREQNKLNWDNKLTLEINGEKSGLVSMTIEPVDVPTVFLAGNSTVVDQDDEPWCGWGQILPRFLNDKVSVANYAESGEAGNSFISAKRFAKILTKMKKGDYLFIEFGHNDQKQEGESKGPYKSYQKSLKQMIDETRKKGATPILVTPMNRRSFDENGKIINTLGDFPDAMRQLAKKQNVMLVDLNSMSKTLYEAWGDEASKKAFVHYPSGTFPNQTQPLADNTHFNSYGGYEICKCVLKGLIDNGSPLKKYIVNDFGTFDPAHPDKEEDVIIAPTPFSSTIKPDGN